VVTRSYLDRAHGIYEYYNKGANVRFLVQPAVRGQVLNTGGHYPYRITFTEHDPIKKRLMMRYGLFDNVDDLNQELDKGGNCLISALLKINSEHDYFKEEELMSYVPPEWQKCDVSRDELRKGASMLPDFTIVLRELTFPKGAGVGSNRKMTKKTYGTPGGKNKFDIALYAGHYFPYDYPCPLTKEYIRKKQYIPVVCRDAYIHTPMSGQAVSSLILVSVIDEDSACKVKWTVEELMKMTVQSPEDEKLTRLDLSPANVYRMCANIHHNPAAKNDWELKKIKKRQKGCYQEIHGYRVEWNVPEKTSSAVGNVVRIGLDGDNPDWDLDVDAFQWPNFGPKRELLPVVFYADFETTKKFDHSYEVPYCMALVEEFTGRKKFYWGEDCAVQFISDLEVWFEKGDNVIVYYHNLGYDEKFIFQKGLRVDKIIATSAAKTIVVYTTLSSGARVTFKDSYRLVNSPEKDFPKMFGLTGMAKWSNYPYHAIIILPDGEIRWKRQDEMDPAHEDEFDEDGRYRCYDLEGAGPLTLKEAAYGYCMCDVLLLRAGMITYKSWTARLGVATDAVLTLPSLASTYAWLQGAHNGVCRYSGSLRAYLSNAIYGGRVMVRENQTTVVDGEIANVDAVSLYPSAMAELTSMPTGPGYPIINKEDLVRFTYYIVTVRITHIERRCSFPWICVTDDAGIRNWTDDISQVKDRDIVVDSIMLKLIYKKHGVRYDVICGWGWDNFIGNWPAVWVKRPGGASGLIKEPLEGWSREHEAVWKSVGWDGSDHSTIQDFLYGRKQEHDAVKLNGGVGNDGYARVSTHLFGERKVLKAAGNPAQLIMKLNMNCLFGKAIEKRRLIKLNVSEAESDWQGKLRKLTGRVRAFYFTGGIRNSNDVHSHVVIEEKVHSLDHKSWPHVGSAILSQSKVIMERLFEKIEKHAFYTDTDSCHMSMAEWKKVEDEFMGSDLGTFLCESCQGHISGEEGVLRKAGERRWIYAEGSLQVEGGAWTSGGARHEGTERGRSRTVREDDQGEGEIPSGASHHAQVCLQEEQDL
jgi:hypothetical protein